MRRLILPTIVLIAMGACSRPAETAAQPASPAANQSPARAARPPSPEALALAARIRAEGAEAVFEDLIGPPDYDSFNAVTDGVATGAPEWLALVPALEPYTDGEYAEGIQQALMQALSLNTAGVLALMPENGSYYFVCGNAPAEARARVEAITDPALAAARTECLAYIDGTAPEMVEINAAN
jgi:hypothetical protein